MMSYKTIALSIVLSSALTLTISYAYFYPLIEQLQQHIESTPPVIVIDKASLALQAVPFGSDKNALDEHFKNVNNLIVKFKEAGFIVLSSSAVIASPEGVNLEVTDLPKNKHLLKNNKNQ